MAGLALIIVGAILILLAPVARMPQVVKWLDKDLDAPHWRAFRRIRLFRGVGDAHYRATKKLLPIVPAPFLLIIGLGMIVTGILEIS